jgi:hypothetical protein
MTLLRRIFAGVVLAALLLCSAPAWAQVLKQLPADPLVVIKVNKPQAVSAKAGKLMQQLGLGNLQPDLADPLNALMKQLKIREGFDSQGELAAAVYADLSQAVPSPVVVVMIPVTNYKVFTGNLAALKDAGAGVSTFRFQEGGEDLFVTNWGSFAAVSDNQEFLAKKPAGAAIASPAAMAQWDKADAVILANTKLMASQVMPQFREAKKTILQEIERNLVGVMGAGNDKFLPVIRALVNQALNVVEGVLKDTSAAAEAINITDKGLTFTVLADFAPDSYSGKAIAGMKNTADDLLVGLPQRKYFVVVGQAPTPEVMTGLMSDLLDPVAKELTALGADGKAFVDLIDVMKKATGAAKSSAVGLAQPTGAPGQQSVLQEVVVTRGDSAVMADAQRRSFQLTNDLMKLMPATPGMTLQMKLDQGAATVAGVKMDKIGMNYVFDPNNPQAAQMKQIIDIMYGPNGMSGVQGAVNATTYVVAFGGDDAFIQAAVNAAKAGDATLSKQASLKAAADMLPTQRFMVMYVYPDNIASTVIAYLNQFGMKVPLKINADIAAMGMSVSTEGSALRVDYAMPMELIENTVSTVIQAISMQAGGNAPPGGL